MYGRGGWKICFLMFFFVFFCVKRLSNYSAFWLELFLWIFIGDFLYFLKNKFIVIRGMWEDLVGRFG